MSRQRRRAKRRARKEREALKQGSSASEEPISFEQAAAKFRFLRCRAFTFGFVPVGPIVEARTPEELRVNTALAIARRMQGEPAN